MASNDVASAKRSFLNNPSAIGTSSDYPEFFHGKLYLESKSSTSTSTESSGEVHKTTGSLAVDSSASLTRRLSVASLGSVSTSAFNVVWSLPCPVQPSPLHQVGPYLECKGNQVICKVIHKGL